MELLDAIDRHDLPHMREELGDVLLQVVLHAEIARENGHFDLEAVAAEIERKLVHRHPHVFGNLDLKTSEDVLRNWDKLKAAEKAAKNNGQAGGPTVPEPPPRLPALNYARDVFKLAVKGGWQAATGVTEAELADLAEGLDEATAGARLFALAAACRRAGVDPETALRRHARGVWEKVADAAPGP